MIDEFEGQGGSYFLDPATGKRTLIRRTREAGITAPVPQAPEPEPEPAIEPAIQPEKDASA